MHKLMEYVCNELEELERKADKEGKLSVPEIEYADTLTRMKKNILKSDEMMEDSEYSMDGGMYQDGSYARGRNRDGRRNYSSRRPYTRSMRRGANQYGSYARDGYSTADDFRMELEDLIEDAPNEQIKRKMRDLMKDM